MIIAIACVDDNWAIGINNHLLFNIKEDMNRFKQITTSCEFGEPIVVMGRNTFESLPNRKPLPNRKNIVLSFKTFLSDMDNLEFRTDASDLMKFQKDPTNCIYAIGGETVYRTFIHCYDKVYLTRVCERYDTNNPNEMAYFPNLEELPNWKKLSESELMKGIDRMSGKEVSYRFEEWNILYNE